MLIGKFSVLKNFMHLAWITLVTDGSTLISVGQYPLLNDMIFNDNLLWARDGVSQLQCARMCVDSDTCAAFTFTGVGSAMTSCRAHSFQMTSCRAHSFQMTSGSAAVATTQTGYFNVMWKGKPCSHSDNCTAHNSDCLSDQCRCVPGHYYSETSFVCLTECSRLSSSMIEYPGSYINGRDNEILGSTSRSFCLDSCVYGRRAFTCRSLDYLAQVNQLCLLSQHIAPVDYVILPTWDVSYYQRTCLNRA